jgi:hypothetical protein
MVQPRVNADVSPPPSGSAECRRCGVCCFSESPTYVRVSGTDWTRLGPKAESLAQFIGNRAFMRMHAGHCAALEVDHDASGSIGFFCTIYEERPQPCRDLERGSPECGGELALKTVGVCHLAAAESGAKRE